MHHVTHQRFGHTGVDGVHTHVVAIVRSPTQSQLTQVTGTDDQTVQTVGQVHENLGPLPGLTVFIGDGAISGRQPNVLKMLCHGLADGDFLKGNV